MTALPHWASRSAAAALAAGAIGVGLELAQVDSPVRGPLVFLFLVVAPALAIAGLIPGINGLARLVIAGAAAIVIDALVATVMLATGVWSPRAGLLAVAVISAAGLAARLPSVRARAARRWPPASVPGPGTAGHDGSMPPAPAAGDAVTAQFGAIGTAPPAAAARAPATSGAPARGGGGVPAPRGGGVPAPRGGGVPAPRDGGAPARPADEATVQLPAVHREPRGDEVATAQFSTVHRRQPGADRAGPHRPADDRAGPHRPADDRAGSQRPPADRVRQHRQPADRAGSHRPPAGPAGSHRPAADDASRQDRPASTDDATVQFPTIGGDE